MDAFEQDMRSAVETYLTPYVDEASLFGSLYEDARARQARESGGEETSLIYYVDLRPCFDLMLRNRQDLPQALADEISKNAALLDAFVPVRNRVMHGRPLHVDDPERALTVVSAFQSRHWEETRGVLNRLRQDPAWEPAYERLSKPGERVLHNLPEADYDDTGFVGRASEKARLLEALKKRREAVITITGEGGIGKTALALELAYELLDSSDNPFEAILWVSLKTEHLTARGVEEINDAIRGMDETVAALGHVIADDFDGAALELADSLEGIETLIIIDNLESAHGSEVIRLYETLPASVRFLFTSRLGIGELERRYPLPALAEKEAKHLFRQFARKRSQGKLLSLSDRALSEVVLRLRLSPLAIRWYILSSEAGRVPLDLLRSQQELLDFCVKNVYEALSDGSRAVLSVLKALDRSISFDEFAVLTDMSIDELRSATQELTRGSLVVVESESAGNLAARLSLTETARAFLPRPDHTGAFIVQVMQRERQFKARIENAALTEERILPRVVRPRDEADHAATHLLYTAINLASSGQIDNALTQIERARSFNPEFSEVYRVAGYVDGLDGRYEAATSEYQNALSFASEPKTRAVTAHSLAWLLAQKMHESNLALPYADEAYKLWPIGDTAFLLGRLKVWTGDYAAGQELLEEAMETATGRQRLFIATTHVDSWRRWGEADLKSRDFEAAGNKGFTGFHAGMQLVSSGGADEKLFEAVGECCVVLLRALAARRDLLPAFEKKLLQVARFLAGRYRQMVNAHKLNYVEESVRAVLVPRPSSVAIVNELERALEGLHASRAEGPGQRRAGSQRTTGGA